MLVQAVKPIRQPAAARFQKHKAQLRETIQQSFPHDYRESDNLLEGVPEKVRIKKLVHTQGAGRLGTIASQEHVDTNRNVEAFGLFIDGKEVGVAHGPSAQVRQERDAGEPQRGYGAAGRRHAGLNIVMTEQAM